MDRADPDPVLDLMKLIKSTTDFSVVFFIFEFGQSGYAVRGAQALHDRLFDNALAIGYRKKRAFDGVPLDGKGIDLSNIVLKRERSYTVKQLCKAARGESTDLDVNALRTSKAHIGAGNVKHLAPKGYTPVDRFKAPKPQGIELLAKLLFKPKQAGCYKFHCLLLSLLKPFF